MVGVLAFCGTDGVPSNGLAQGMLKLRTIINSVSGQQYAILREVVMVEQHTLLALQRERGGKIIAHASEIPPAIRTLQQYGPQVASAGPQLAQMLRMHTGYQITVCIRR